MIKIDTRKGKILSFDINIKNGSEKEIKEGRFILYCPNKTYSLMFKALVKNSTVTVDLPPLNISETSGSCSLEMISTDEQYYIVWEDEVEFNKNMIIKVKEQKEIEKKPIVTFNEAEIIEEKKEINSEGKIIKSSETVNLYRTIKCNLEVLNKILSEHKFLMKPKSKVYVKFYENNSMLLNDLENIEYGISVRMNVPENGIIEKRNDHTIIVDSSYLDNVNENNVLFLINNGKIVKFGKNKLL